MTILVNACVTTKIFCRPNCPPGRRTKSWNRVFFENIDLARDAGFRACKVCKPEQGKFSVYQKKSEKRID